MHAASAAVRLTQRRIVIRLRLWMHQISTAQTDEQTGGTDAEDGMQLQRGTQPMTVSGGKAVSRRHAAQARSRLQPADRVDQCAGRHRAAAGAVAELAHRPRRCSPCRCSTSAACISTTISTARSTRASGRSGRSRRGEISAARGGRRSASACSAGGIVLMAADRHSPPQPWELLLAAVIVAYDLFHKGNPGRAAGHGALPRAGLCAAPRRPPSASVAATSLLAALALLALSPASPMRHGRSVSTGRAISGRSPLLTPPMLLACRRSTQGIAGPPDLPGARRCASLCALSVGDAPDARTRCRARSGCSLPPSRWSMRRSSPPSARSRRRSSRCSAFPRTLDAAAIHHGNLSMTRRGLPLASTPDPAAVDRLLRRWPRAHAAAPRPWPGSTPRSTGSGRPSTNARLAIALGLAARKLGRADLSLSAAELAAAQDLRAGWQPELWGGGRGGARRARARDLPRRRPGLRRAHRAALRHRGGRPSSSPISRALRSFRRPRRYTARAREGVRASMRPPFEAIACHNPYPFDYFDEAAWNQMVVKCVFDGRADRRDRRVARAPQPRPHRDAARLRRPSAMRPAARCPMPCMVTLRLARNAARPTGDDHDAE